VPNTKRTASIPIEADTRGFLRLLARRQPTRSGPGRQPMPDSAAIAAAVELASADAMRAADNGGQRASLDLELRQRLGVDPGALIEAGDPVSWKMRPSQSATWRSSPASARLGMPMSSDSSVARKASRY